jgi:Fe-S-cluster containining protein
MTATNACGECTACCKTHGVKSIQKPIQSACPHCSTRCGCSIYEKRPLECQDFECSWLFGKGGGENCRPDKTGIVPVHVALPEIGVILILTEFREESLKSEFAFKWTWRNLFLGNWTIHHSVRGLQGKSRLYLPRGAADLTLQEKTVLEEQLEREVEVILFTECLRNLVL